jgi:hypothetical protein
MVTNFETKTGRPADRISGSSRLTVFIAVAMLIIVLPATTALADVWKGKEETKDGVVHVMNPQVSMAKPATIELEEAWRIGGEDDEELFGVITSIISDDDGNVYMLDAQLNEIKVYDADGEWLRNIGREGEGPGEFRGAFSMFQVPGGNIGVLQTFPSKIVVLTPEGDPAGEYPIPEPNGDEGFRVLFGARYAGDNLAMVYAFNQPTQTGFTQKNILALVDSKGTTEIRLHDQSSTMDAANAKITEKGWDTFRNRWTAAPDGRAFSCLTLGEYAITVWSADGKVDRVIHRDYPEHVRSEAERERILDIYKGFTRQIPIPGIKFEIEDTFNQVQQINARADGTLWVQTSRGANGLDEGTIGIFDVFDKQGRLSRQLTLKGEGDPLNDGYFFVKDRLYVVTDFLSAMMALQGGAGEEGEEEDEDEVELMQIISYKLN